jgi:hypothetical protein
LAAPTTGAPGLAFASARFCARRQLDVQPALLKLDLHSRKGIQGDVHQRCDRDSAGDGKRSDPPGRPVARIGSPRRIDTIRGVKSVIRHGEITEMAKNGSVLRVVSGRS